MCVCVCVHVCFLCVCVCVCVCVLWPITVTGASQDVMDTLCELYWHLKEEDMWAGLFAKRARFPETNIAIAYEQHGFFEQAQTQYEQVSMFMKLEKRGHSGIILRKKMSGSTQNIPNCMVSRTRTQGGQTLS